MIYPESLAANGWIYFDKCRCSGVLKYKFRNKEKPGMEVEWRPKLFQFKISEKGKTKIGLTKIGMLKETLEGL